MSDPQHLRLVEALIFAAVKPLEESELAKRLPDDVDVPNVLLDLAALYAERGVNLVKRGDGWAFRTAGDLGAILGKEVVVTRKLPKAAAETLAILAYQKGGEGVTRAEIEDIRGVSVSQGTLDLLFEAGWVRPLGRKEAPGRPMLWGTTPAFLDHFGLKSLDDLPGIEELKSSGMLDGGPAIAYAARANDDPLPGEEPVEPLGDGEDQAMPDGVTRAVNGDGNDEEALERAALADEILDTPEALEAEDEDQDDDESEDDEDSASDEDDDFDDDEDDVDEEDDEDDDEDTDSDDDEDDGFDDDDDEEDDVEDDDSGEKDASSTESATAEK